MTCPFTEHKNLKTIPCNWYTPDGYSNLRVCDICQRHYRVDEIARKYNPEGSLFLLLLLIVVTAIIGSVAMLSESESDRPQNYNRFEKMDRPFSDRR